MKFKEYDIRLGLEKDEYSEYDVTLSSIDCLSDFDEFNFEKSPPNAELFIKIENNNNLYLDWIVVTKSIDGLSALCFMFFYWDTWVNPYNIKEYIQELTVEFEKKGITSELDDNYSEGVGISYTLKSISGIKELRETNQIVIAKCINNAKETCIERIKERVLLRFLISLSIIKSLALSIYYGLVNS